MAHRRGVHSPRAVHAGPTLVLTMSRLLQLHCTRRRDAGEFWPITWTSPWRSGPIGVEKTTKRRFADAASDWSTDEVSDAHQRGEVSDEASEEVSDARWGGK